MPKKRKSRGRAKGSKGRVHRVHCSMCGALVPADKVKKVTRWVSPVDPQLARELESQGAHIFRRREVKYYCISCAIFHGIVRIRSREERKVTKPLR